MDSVFFRLGNAILTGIVQTAATRKTAPKRSAPRIGSHVQMGTALTLIGNVTVTMIVEISRMKPTALLLHVHRERPNVATPMCV